ncbi:terpene synthase family protein [Nonomuraea sp. 10N515B]|uniref:terpene synthase family protein n=1 Tax=Nonomuraea sp. 10N515B TaxID=3457422 RepID=UPI003FCEBA48
MPDIPSVSLPDPFIPYPSKLNPFEAVVAEHTIAWARRLKLIEDETATSRFAGESYSRLVARLYPEASVPVLALAADLNSWFHVYDDQFELAEVGSDPDLARRMADKFHAVLDGAPLEATAGPILHGLADIRDRMRLHAGARWWHRFATHLQDCFETAQWEVDNRTRGRIPDPDSYVEHKLNIAYVPPSFDLIELAEQFEVPDAIRASAAYRTLVHEAGHVVVCTNDLIGLRRELLQGEFHNLVIVYWKALSCPLQEAVEMVDQKISERIGIFEAAKVDLVRVFDELGIDENRRHSTLRCVMGLENWMRGYLDWAKETRRFADPVLRGEVTGFQRELVD